MGIKDMNRWSTAEDIFAWIRLKLAGFSITLPDLFAVAIF
jgi:hypothetical protein